MIFDKFSFNGNPKLKKPGAKIEFTEEQIKEYIKCSADPVYFMTTYVKVINVDKGPMIMDLRDYQQRFVKSIHAERMVIAKASRQQGKSSLAVAYVLHYALFKESKNCIIVGNKASTAKMLMNRLQYAYENLPVWMQQGVVEWNKSSIVLENGSSVNSYATSSSGVRGQSCVTGDTHITVRNKITGENQTPTMMEFVVLLDQPNNLKIYTTEWEVLTPSGWQSFDGVLVTEDREVIALDDAELTCTPNHQVWRDGKWIEAQYIKHTKIPKRTKVYDLINVGNGNAYYTNKEISHNCSLLLWDEAGFVPNNIAEDFWVSMFPTISSGTETKVIISSTPNGYNLFWKLWSEAEQKINGFIPIEMFWWEVPGRDKKWYEEQLRVLGPVKTAQEIDAKFAGSGHTLISADTIGAIPAATPIKEADGIKIFFNPIPEHHYIAIVDTARGTDNDYSVIVVVDITTIPYSVALVYKNNSITPYAFPQAVFNLATTYNKAYCLIENNDSGGQVADTLFEDFDYENMFYSKGGTLKEPNTKLTIGVKTTSKVKRLGASAIKTIIENGHLLVNDRDIISEMSVFVSKKGSFAAESGDYHDDLMMCLVLFGWLTQQQIFKDLTDTDTRAKLFDKQAQEINDMFLPLGMVSTGLEEIDLGRGWLENPYSTEPDSDRNFWSNF